jgi:hypothetical protein
VSFTDFNAANVKLSKLRTLDNGGKIVYLSYNEKPLVLQTPEMVAPYGMSKWDNDGKGPAKYTLDLSFKGMDTRDLLKKFYTSLQEFDSNMVKGGLQHSEEWFKKKYQSAEVVEALYTCVVRRSKDDKYPPTFKMTVPYDNNTGEFRVKVFDKVSKKQVDLNDVNLKGAKVTALVQCTGVWIAGGKFGTTWKVVQLRVEQSAKITEYAFRDIEGDKADDLEEEEEEDDEDDDDVEVKPVGSVKEDDDFVDSEDELEKKPAKVVKKVVAKKK